MSPCPLHHSDSWQSPSLHPHEESESATSASKKFPPSVQHFISLTVLFPWSSTFKRFRIHTQLPVLSWRVGSTPHRYQVMKIAPSYPSSSTSSSRSSMHHRASANTHYELSSSGELFCRITLRIPHYAAELSSSGKLFFESHSCFSLLHQNTKEKRITKIWG